MFKNFKVTACMGSPIATTSEIILDSIIVAALYKENLGEDYFAGNNKYADKQVLDEMLKEVLDKKQGVYCTSYAIGDNKEFVSKWSKRFCVKNDDLVKYTGKGKERLDIGAGHFKNYHMPLVVRSYKKVEFYVRGNLDKIKYLLENYIHFLGKKSSQGYGEVLTWEFKEIHEDYSLWKDGINMRSIPFSECTDNVSKEQYRFNIRNYPTIPPYWRHDNKELCIV